MGKTIAISGPRGGIGKSSAAVNLSASFGILEKKTLLIDCDPQGSASAMSGVKSEEHIHGLADLLSGRCSISQAVSRTDGGIFDIIPSYFDLFPVSLKLAKHPGNEKLLRIFLRDIREHYDYIIIDSPSSHSFLSTMAMASADHAVACLSAQTSSSRDVHLLLKMVKHIRLHHDVNLRIMGFLFNLIQSDRDVEIFIEKQDLSDLKGLIFDTAIPLDDHLKKAGDKHMPAAFYDIKSKSSQAFLNLAEQLNLSFNLS